MLFKVWDDIICQASKNVDVLKEIEIVKQLASILKTNVRACKALNHAYFVQLGRIYLDMLNVYKVYLKIIVYSLALLLFSILGNVGKYCCSYSIKW